MAASNGIFNGATVTTSNDDSGTYPGANVIDGSNATFWHTANVGVPHWIKFDLGVGVLKAVESYRWTPRSTDDTHSPVAFLFQGSNDDSTWDTIDSQTAQNDWSNGTERTFTVTNCGQYRYYRFYITATLSNTYCCAGEIGADLAGENTIEVPLSSISQWILGGDGWEGGVGSIGNQGATSWAFVAIYNALNIPPGSTITSATAKFLTTSLAGDIHELVYFNNVDDATFPGSAASAESLALTSSISWNDVSGGGGSPAYSPNLASILQTIIDRSGWESGNQVQLIAKNNSSDGYGYFQAGGETENTLTITYIEPIEYSAPIATGGIESIVNDTKIHKFTILDYGEDVTLPITATGQGATASSYYGGGEYAYQAFDHTTGSGSNMWAATGAGPDWLKIDLSLAPDAEVGRTASISAYAITARGDGYPSYNMNTWVLSGSNNDSDWDELDSQSDISWNVGERKVFSLATPSAEYRYFKITGVAPSGNAAICELELLRSVPPVLNVSFAGFVEILVIGGGGGGGKGEGPSDGDAGGGGGAGGVRWVERLYVPAGEHDVYVGSGGDGAVNVQSRGGSGDNSSFYGIIALGGGGGGSDKYETPGVNDGANGGSGGGAAGKHDTATIKGFGTTGQGNDGGASGAPGEARRAGAGGGGAGGVGADASGNTGGAGGSGTDEYSQLLIDADCGVDVSGTHWIAGGGGGGRRSYTADAAGGIGGGGTGGSGAGVADSGGGGGGSHADGGTGGVGGSGIIIIRYSSNISIYLSTQDGTNIIDTSVSLHGTITTTGDLPVTERGFCYKAGTSGDPNINDDRNVHDNDDSFPAGTYSYDVSGLIHNTGYRVRAYAINEYDTFYGNTVQITTLDEIVYTETLPSTGITSWGFIANGDIVFGGISAITRKGFCIKKGYYPSSLLRFQGSNQSVVFTDDTGKTWVPEGNAQISDVSSVSGETCGLFDGSSEIYTPHHSDFVFGSDDFTIDVAIRATAVGQAGTSCIIGKAGNQAEAEPILIGQAPGTYELVLYMAVATAWDLMTALNIGTLVQGVWSRLKIVRYKTRIFTFFNNTLRNVVSIGTVSLLNAITPLRVGGGNYADCYFTGNIGDLRVIKGYADFTNFPIGESFPAAYPDNSDMNIWADISGSTPFSIGIGGLEKNTKYNLRAYATNTEGTGYGGPVNVVTNDRIDTPTTDYLTPPRRDRMLTRGVSAAIHSCEDNLFDKSPELQDTPTHIDSCGAMNIVYTTTVPASSFITFEEYVNPLQGNEGRLWLAGDDYEQMSFHRTFYNDNRSVSLMANKGNLCFNNKF